MAATDEELWLCWGVGPDGKEFWEPERQVAAFWKRWMKFRRWELRAAGRTQQQGTQAAAKESRTERKAA